MDGVVSKFQKFEKGKGGELHAVFKIVADNSTISLEGMARDLRTKLGTEKGGCPPYL